MRRAHEHVDVAARVAAGPERRIDRSALDVEQVDPDLLGQVLHGGMPESQAHRKRHADLGFAHARCTTSSITLPRRAT